MTGLSIQEMLMHLWKPYRQASKRSKILMEDLNIQAQPGQMIAIVGPTGAGKTTLVNLLMRNPPRPADLSA